MKQQHIVLTGAKQVGKSTLLERLLQHCTVPLGGFLTRSTPRQPDGTHSVYLYPAGSTERPTETQNHIGDACFGLKTTHPEVFETLGVQYLSCNHAGLIVMDELGFMESDAKNFCRAVLNLFDGDTPILAVCKDKPGIPLLDAVRSHPNTKLYTVTEQNREELFEELLPILLRWN